MENTIEPPPGMCFVNLQFPQQCLRLTTVALAPQPITAYLRPNS
jgi:hypothetical protein